MLLKRFKTKGYILALSIIICCISFAHAYDDEITHPDITEKAVIKSNFNEYLKNSLEMQEGLTTSLKSVTNKSNSILEWIKNGSTDEDAPMCRASNHFHNPLLPWDQSYLTDQPWWLDAACFNWKPFHSNVTWATGYLLPPPSGTKESFNINPYFAPYNWDKARNNYYDALTSYTKENREIYFVWMFTTLGHIVHLLEDVSVPAHVRNDFTSHLIFNGINSFDPTEWFIQPFENYVKNNPGAIDNAPQPDDPTFSDIKLTDFWDTNQYDGNTSSTSLSLGLSEFTNANYFSDSTIWNNSPSTEHTFPFPKVGNSDHQICVGLSPDGSEYRRYISRKSEGNCPPIYQADQVDHFAAVSLLEDEIKIAGPDISMLKLWLDDDNVHKTYANELVPRAIGYSAALLNYFFRGEINIVHAGLDMIKIENLSNEDMEGDISSFQLYYDDTSNNRYEIPLIFYDELGNTYDKVNNPNTVLTIPAKSISSFKIKLNGVITNPKNPDEYIFVFKGRIGNEGTAPYDTAYAVAAKVFKGNMNIYQINNDTFHIVNMSSQDMEGDLNSFTMTYKDVGGNQQGVALDFFDASGNPYSGILSIPANSTSSFTVRFNTVPHANAANPGEYTLTFKGKIGSEGTAPYNNDYAVTSQLITPHFLADAQVNGQWDIYEYDLLGNRIYNVTGALERGVVHHLAVQNPVDPDMIAITSNMECPDVTKWPPYQVCVRVLKKSTGAVTKYDWVRIPFWSKDGQKLYDTVGLHYDISTGGDFITPSDWSIEGCSGYGSDSIPSLSPDGSILVAQQDQTAFPAPVPVDIFFFAPAIYPNNSAITEYVDMNVMQVISPYELGCQDYLDDEIYFDMAPDFHPSENIIVFDSDAAGPFNIYYADVSDLVNSREILQLTNAPGGDFGYFNAAWSPDGQKLLLLWQKAVNDGMMDVYIMPPAVGAIPTRITTDGGSKDYPRWVPYLGQ